jgi:hypothetical protein
MEPSMLINWLKEKGEPILKGKPLIPCGDTQDIYEVCSDFDGVVEQLLVSRWAKVRPSQEIAVLQLSAGKGQRSDAPLVSNKHRRQ